MNPEDNQFKPRTIRCAGNINPLNVISLRANCGDIWDGVAFAFGEEGGWVVDFNDLKRIVKEAEALR